CAAPCSVANSSRSLWLITFGAGTDPYSQQTPSHFNFNTTYQQRFDGQYIQGQFALMNKVANSYSWHAIAEDHTPNDVNGYMMLIDLAEDDGSVIFNTTVHGLCIDSQYEFSAYFANTVKKGHNFAEPNIYLLATQHIRHNLSVQRSWTGNLLEYNQLTWSKHGLLFTASTSSVVLQMIANGNDDIGRDLVIDDIELRVCSNFSTGYCPSDEPTTAQNLITSTTNPNGTSTAVDMSSASTATSGIVDSCSIANSSRSLLLITFGAGIDLYSQQTPSTFNFTTTYEQRFDGYSIVAQFALMNKVPSNSDWHAGSEDHTPN
ncbi:unnamed protein product, partial [Adineta ricciae]